ELIALLLLSARTLIDAIPRRGNEPWSVILCKFKDSDYEPRTAEWFSEWISGGDNPGSRSYLEAAYSHNFFFQNGTTIFRNPIDN
ncbi:hypothetical protein KIN20_024515, partial [Parelaphostrongylus tenuis]